MKKFDKKIKKKIKKKLNCDKTKQNKGNNLVYCF